MQGFIDSLIKLVKMVTNQEKETAKNDNTILIIVIIVIAVLALLFLLMLPIFAGISSSVDVSGMGCLNRPLEEIETCTQKAKSGLDVSTRQLCLRPGEKMNLEDFDSKIPDASMAFLCGHGPCQKLEIKPFELTATEKVMFSLIVHCELSDGPTKYDCLLSIEDAP